MTWGYTLYHCKWQMFGFTHNLNFYSANLLKHWWCVGYVRWYCYSILLYIYYCVATTAWQFYSNLFFEFWTKLSGFIYQLFFVLSVLNTLSSTARNDCLIEMTLIMGYIPFTWERREWQQKVAMGEARHIGSSTALAHIVTWGALFHYLTRGESDFLHGLFRTC